MMATFLKKCSIIILVCAILVCVIGIFTPGCKDTTVSGSVKVSGHSGHIDNYEVQACVVRKFSSAPARTAQFALLVPDTWSGLSTETQTSDGQPFVHNGTTITWADSNAVAAKAETLMGGPPPPSFKWVGFESNVFTPDPNITYLCFTQIITCGNAPTGDLGGAENINIFVGDSESDNDSFYKLPVEVGTYSLSPGGGPTLSEWGLIIMAGAILTVGVIAIIRWKRVATV